MRSDRTNPGGRPRRRPRLEGPFNEWIDQAVREQGLRGYNEFADRHGLGRSTLSDLRNGRAGRVGARLRTLERLAVALGRSLAEVLERYRESAGGAGGAQEAEEAPVRVPVFACGPGGAGARPEGWVWAEPALARGRDLAAFRVQGRAMLAGPLPLGPGDLVLVDRRALPRPGEAVVARLADGAHLCRLLVQADGGGGAWLAAADPHAPDAYPPALPLKAAEVVGPVVEARRRPRDARGEGKGVGG